MSIVHHLPELPEEGAVVYADNGDLYCADRAIYKDGNFIGGGDFPFPEYTMSFVSKWFYLDEYGGNIEPDESGNKCYTVSFEKAEKMSC